MTENEKIGIVKTLAAIYTVADNDISVYLSVASDAILTRLYSVSQRPEGAIVPVRYEFLQCKLAARYVLRRGAEGEVTHDENGIVRHYGSVDDADILNEVLPYAEVV